MTTTHAADAADRQDERKRKRGAVIKFSLAGAALLGIAAAATSAAWTDDAWFKGTASAATKSTDLRGSIDNSSFSLADTVGGAVTITTDLAALVPDETRHVTLYVKNFGTEPLHVEGTPVGSDDLFEGADPVSLTLDTASFDLAAGDTEQIDLTVHAPDWTNGAYSDAEGAIAVTFTGTQIN